VQTILGRHGGHLSVDSVEGEGSRFTLRVPIGDAAGAARAAEPAA
jgi:signal transduction histidine kinase